MSHSGRELKHLKMHVFHDYYRYLCNSYYPVPLSIFYIRRRKLNNSKESLKLDADFINYNEWMPILKALAEDCSLQEITLTVNRSNKVLGNVRTESKVHLVTKKPVILTTFLLNKFLTSLEGCLRNSPALTILAIEGICLEQEHLKLLFKGLHNNSTVQSLSFKNSKIGNKSCEYICQHLTKMSNLLKIDFSSCQLGSSAGYHVAELIKYHKNCRYIELWQESLNSHMTQLDNMTGLREVILNDNKELVDAGILPIINELFDDLWIKGLYIQNCGITKNGAKFIGIMLAENRTLTRIDARANPLDKKILQMIMDFLDRRHIPKRGRLRVQTSFNDILYSEPTSTISSSSRPISTLNSQRSVKLVHRVKSNTKKPVKQEKAKQDDSTTRSSNDSRALKSVELNSKLVEDLSDVCDSIHVFVRHLKIWTGVDPKDIENPPKENSPKDEELMDTLLRKVKSAASQFSTIKQLLSIGRSESPFSRRSESSQDKEKMSWDSIKIENDVYLTDQRNPCQNKKIAEVLHTIKYLKKLIENHPASKSYDHILEGEDSQN